MTEGFSPWQAHQVLFLQETGTFASSSARGPALCCSTWRGGERGQRCPQSRESRVLISHEPRGGAQPFRGRIFSMLALLHLLFLLHGSLAFRDPTGDVPVACGPCTIYQVRATCPEPRRRCRSRGCPRQPPAFPWAFRCCSSASACGWLELFKLIDVWHQCNAVCCH